MRGEGSNQSDGSFSSQEAQATFFSPEDKFTLSSRSLSRCFSHPADAANNEQNMESGCQTGSQMDSVGIGEVRQCDDEWRTELTVLEMKCAFLAAKYVTTATATQRPVKFLQNGQNARDPKP